MLSVESVSFSYGTSSVVSDVSFDIAPGEVVVIMGPSGSGKSTLFRIITGLQAPDQGECKFFGQPIQGVARNMFLGFQDYDGFPWHTVASNISISRQLATGLKPSMLEIREIAQHVGLNESLERYPSELSGGMRKRLAFARCIASQAKLVILDEPFSSLDSSSRRELQLLTGELVKTTECGVLMCTHDAHEAALVAHRVLICSGKPLSIRRTVNITYPAPTEADPVGYGAIEETAHLLIRELAYISKVRHPT